MKKKTATKIIFLEDKGQDFLVFYVDDRGEILKTEPLMGHVWNGRVIKTKSIKVGSSLKFIGGFFLKYNVKKIESFL